MAINYNLTLKLIFLIFLFLIFCYLLYLEYHYTDKLNLVSRGGVLKSSYRFTLGLKELLFTVIPGGIAYISYFKDEFKLQKLQEELAKKENEIVGLQTQSVEANTQKDEALKIIRETRNELSLINQNKAKLNSLEGRDSELSKLIKEANGFEKQTKLAEKESLSKEINQIKESIDNSTNQIEKICNDILTKSSIISFDYNNLQNFLDTLSKEELLAFSGLLFNGLALNYAVNIMIVIYSDYLIKRFDLENKYPKLAKFIEVRRKLQNFYLKICFFWLLVGILPPLCVYAYIILPKLLEIFN